MSGPKLSTTTSSSNHSSNKNNKNNNNKMEPLLFTGVVAATVPAARPDVSDAGLCVPKWTSTTSTTSPSSPSSSSTLSAWSSSSSSPSSSCCLSPRQLGPVVPDLASEQHMGDAVGNARSDPKMEDGPSLPGSPELSDPVAWSLKTSHFVAVSDIRSRDVASTDQVAGRQTGHAAVAQQPRQQPQPQQQQQRPQQQEEQCQQFPQKVGNHARPSSAAALCWKDLAKTPLPPVTRASSKEARQRNTDPHSDARQPPAYYELHSIAEQEEEGRFRKLLRRVRRGAPRIMRGTRCSVELNAVTPGSSQKLPAARSSRVATL
ncbi:unnamed protein product [Polarella glacialis]|uniref:Uncharacterized protein n=1 Tax=Polarella glacialis TaxID=89957 RepID=A0A813EVA3_POLGL|nr:unnamed protein product [Polarella glacialis]